MESNTNISKKMEEKVLQYIEERELLKEGDRVLAGVSGGADSVCLLFVLLALRERWACKSAGAKGTATGGSQETCKASVDELLCIEVVHVHHMIRGAEADEDMAYVEMLCRQHGLACHIVKEPVEQIATEQGLSVEEAGRKIRYEAFERISRERNLNKIAVAHHRDDNAETILMNLFRGSGLKGVSGIPPVRGNIVRPLLNISREEIEGYLNECGIAYRTDSTNLDCDYTRNKVRNELLPYIKKNINAKATEHLVQFGARAGEIDDYFQKKAKILFEKYGRIEQNRVILCLDCLNEEKMELTYLIRKIVACLASGLKDIGQEHIEQIIKLMNGRTGGKCQLPGRILVEKSYERCIFSSLEHCEIIQIAKARTKNSHIGEGMGDYVEVNLTGLQDDIPFTATFSNAKFTFTVKNMKKNETFPKKKYTKWFNCDKIKFTLRIRTRENGDYITINSTGGRKKLKDYFIDNKISREERDKMILLAEGSEVLWVTGMRISERYKVDENTTKILEVCME